LALLFSFLQLISPLGAAFLVSLLVAPLSWAGSITAESGWDKNNAIQRARQQIPADAKIAGEKCTTIEVGLSNTRYRCSVNFTDP